MADVELLLSLVPVLARSLDVRGLFKHISAAAHEVLPHDLMTLGILREDRRGGRLYALAAGGDAREDVGEDEFPPELAALLELDYMVGHDLAFDRGRGTVSIALRTPKEAEARRFEAPMHPTWIDRLDAVGVRSLIQVPLRLGGAIVGHVGLFSREPRRYGCEDAAVAARIADFVALAVAHERLAEAERETALARERARQLEARVDELTRELAGRGGARAPIGTSAPWRAVLAQVATVSPTDATVLITGESGTGKEVIARLVHGASRRSAGPFVALNCAALPEHLLESEVFGYERGAFTGAAQSHAGRIEQAAGGTLFLDEVGEMTPGVQAKLLRVLEEREFQRLGSARTQKADVRIVAATNRDLMRAVADGRFREDLYYRLHVFGIHLPPLRERGADVLELVEHFLAEVGAGIGRPAAGLSREARDRLLTYHWPGNVRELRNAVERAVILANGGLVQPDHLPVGTAQPRQPSPQPGAMATAPAGGGDADGALKGRRELDEIERDMIVRALRETGQNKAKAARLLGLTRAQLYTRIAKHGLE